MPEKNPPKKKTIYVSDPNDKRLQAYNDSLALYNLTQENYGSESFKKYYNKKAKEVLYNKDIEEGYIKYKGLNKTNIKPSKVLYDDILRIAVYDQPVQPYILEKFTKLDPKKPTLSNKINEDVLQTIPVKNAIQYPKDVQRYSAGSYLESKGKPSGYTNMGDNTGRKPLFADGGYLNNNNTMVNEYKGDSHFDPSGGITLANAIVEDGELEYKGYVFSKDSEENKQLRREMKIRKIRTDEEDYVWDRISRESLKRAAAPLVESHEKNRLDKLMADLEKAEKGLDEAGIPPQGDMPVDPSQMGQLPIMAEGGTIPKVTTNQQYDQSFIDPSNMYSDNISTDNLSGEGSKSRMTGSDYAGYASQVGQIGSTVAKLGPEDPYYKGQTDKGVQTGQQLTDQVVSSIPMVGQFYQAGKGLGSLSTAGKADMRSQGNQEGAEAAAFAEGFSDPFGAIMNTADKYESGIYTEEQATGVNALNLLFPGLGSAVAEGEGIEKEAFDNIQKKKLFEQKLANRDYGGTAMDPRQERNRQVMSYGGFKNKQVMATGGEKPKLNSLNMNFLTGQSREENTKPPYIYNSYDNIFDMNQNLPTMMQPLSQSTNTPSNVPQITQTATANKPTYSVSGNATAPNTPMSAIGSNGNLPADKKKVDWANVGESVGMGLLSNIGNLAFLADQGKDYDKVDYGSFNPEMVNTSSSRRAIRDSIATSKEALKESGRFDRAAMAQLGTQGAKQLADAEERIRLANTGMFNDAQLKNLDINMREKNDEAMNKGQALTNYYNALNALGQNSQAAYRGYNLRQSDAEKQRLVEENNIFLKQLVDNMYK